MFITIPRRGRPGIGCRNQANYRTHIINSYKLISRAIWMCKLISAVLVITKSAAVRELTTFLHQNNEFIKLFKTALDRMPSDSHNIIIGTGKNVCGWTWFNSLTIDEVVVVIIVEENFQYYRSQLIGVGRLIKTDQHVRRSYNKINFSWYDHVILRLILINTT